jgi:hypothetical protein
VERHNLRLGGEALREVSAAKQSWLEAARAEGKPVPFPQYRPAIYQVSP